MTTPTLYARRELTTDSTLLQQHAKGLLTKPLATFRDVQLYFDKGGTRPAARYPWHYAKSKPDRRRKWVMLNCVRHRLEWLPDPK